MSVKKSTVEKYTAVIDSIAQVLTEHPIQGLSSLTRGRGVSSNLATWLKMCDWVTVKTLPTSGRVIYCWSGPYPVTEAHVESSIMPLMQKAFEKIPKPVKAKATQSTAELAEALGRMEVQLIKQTELLTQLVTAFTK